MDTKPSSIPVVETITKTALTDFEATATFKLSNIKQYFEDDDHTPQSPYHSTVYTQYFGPKLKLGISRSPIQRGIAVHLYLPDSSILPRPVFVDYSFSFSSSVDANKTIYCTKFSSHPHEWVNNKGWGWSPALSREDWEAGEPIGTTDSIYILARVVGSLSQTPTPRAPTVLSLLHENIIASPQTVFRFTAFNCLNADGVLSDRQIFLADREIVKNTCAVLHDVLSGKTEWKSFFINDSADDNPAQAEDEDDSDFEYEPKDDINIAERSSDSLSTESKEAEPSAPVHGSDSASEDAEHENRASEATAEKTDMESVKVQDSYTDDQMQIDDGLEDIKAANARSIQTDPSIVDDGALSVVVIGAAAATWEAFIFYLYTGIVEFAPLRSNGVDARAAYIRNSKADKRPKPCSPKSMYRLADKLEQAPLKQLALKKILERVNLDNILEELFSTFTSAHEEVKEQELQFLSQHCDEVMNSQAFKDLMVDIAVGTYPHAGKLLGEVFRRTRDAPSASSTEGIRGSTK